MWNSAIDKAPPILAAPVEGRLWFWRTPKGILKFVVVSCRLVSTLRTEGNILGPCCVISGVP